MSSGKGGCHRLCPKHGRALPAEATHRSGRGRGQLHREARAAKEVRGQAVWLVHNHTDCCADGLYQLVDAVCVPRSYKSPRGKGSKVLLLNDSIVTGQDLHMTTHLVLMDVIYHGTTRDQARAADPCWPVGAGGKSTTIPGAE